MEFDIKVKIDWLQSDGTLDEVVKEEIVERVVKALSKTTVDGITKEAATRVDRKLDELVTRLFNDFMSKTITITDGWGETRQKDVKILDLMKQKLDAALDEKVDEDGKPSGYRADRPRLHWLIDQRVKWAIEEVTRRLDRKIEERLSAALREKLSESLLAKMDIDSVVKEVLSKLKK
ncbi:MAG: hypothetical protein ACM3ZU_08190 [Bacteroidota bacterium]